MIIGINSGAVSEIEPLLNREKIRGTSLHLQQFRLNLPQVEESP